MMRPGSGTEPGARRDFGPGSGETPVQRGEPARAQGVSRVIEESVPGKQVTIAHVIASPVPDVYECLGIDPLGAIGILDVYKRQAREGAAQMMSHPAASLVLASGAPEMLEEARSSGKPVIFCGTGPSPAFIERTADVKQAAEDILCSRSFDCGTAAASEQYVVVDAAVAEQAKREMIRLGAHFMSGEEEEMLIRLLCGVSGHIDPEYMGCLLYTSHR